MKYAKYERCKRCKIAFISRHEKHEIQSFSMSVPHLCPVGLMIEFDYYGDKEPKLILLHIIQQLYSSLSFYKHGSIHVSVFVEQNVDVKALEQLLSEVSLLKSKLKVKSIGCFNNSIETISNAKL